MSFLSRYSGTKILILSLLLSLVFVMQVSAQAEYLDNKGREFIMTFLHNYSTPAVELHLASDVATNVTVEYPFAAPTFTTTVAVAPGAVTIVSLPYQAANGWNVGVVHNNAVHAVAPDEFICYMINRYAYTSDAALALPVDAMNRNFIVATYTGSSLHSSDAGEFAVVAATDGTEVTIVPTNALQGGHPAGVPFVVNLDRGQAYFTRTTAGNGPGADLTGTMIESNFPISMTNGNRCANVPASVAACDHVFEVAQPLQSWGNRVFVTNLPQRDGGSFYRIIAGADNTTVMQDGVAIGTINTGQYLDVEYLTGSHVFEGDNAIFVVQFMSGDSNPGATDGDPAMGNIAPSEQYLYDYTFSTVGGSQFANNYLSMIAHNDDVTGGTILLDGSVVAAGLFSPIPGSDYSAAVIPLNDGTHTTMSTQMAHGITVEGYNGYDSYIFPGGALFVPINPVNDTIPPVCNTVSNDGCMVSLMASDIHDEATGVYFVSLTPGSVNLTLTVDPFDLGAPTVTYSVTATDPSIPGYGAVTVVDGDGNTCATDIQVNCGVSETADVFGQVTVAGVGLLGVEVHLLDAMNMPMAMMYTDVDGLYRFEDINSGDYTVEITVPLSLSPASASSVPITLAGLDMEVNFELEQVDQGKFLHKWAWRLYLADLAEDGPRKDIFTVADVEHWSALIFEHFYDRSDGYAIQCPLLTFADDPARPMTFDEIVFSLANDPDRSYASYVRKYLLALMLNVVSNRASQMMVVTDDGGTLSQILTYYSDVLETGTEGELRAARTYLQMIHLGDMIPAGVIPVCCIGNVMFKDDDGFAQLDDLLPNGFALSQNYPNPFNPSTEISFTLPVAGDVTLEVFNISGQKVATLAKSYFEAGTHVVTWNAEAVASGVYLYRLQADDLTDMRKMILLK